MTEFIQSIETVPQAIVTAALILALAWVAVTMMRD
jgi:hypothetical protein